MRFIFSILVALALAAPVCGQAIFDRVVAKGKGFEIKASQVNETYIAFKANRTAIGQPTPETPEAIKKTELEILDSLIASKLLLARATEADRTNGAAEAAKFIEQKKKEASSEAAFRRQLIISGMSLEQFEKEVRDQGVIKSLVDREIRAKQTVTDEDIEKFYKENIKMFQEPEKWKVAHIFMNKRDTATRQEISEKEKEEKKAKLAKILVSAKAGVDFAKLAKENSEHNLTRDIGGEQTFVKNQMPPEFEAAALSMKPGQISDMVTTGLGWHIIKFLEYVPAKTLELAESKEKVREILLQQATQKALPDFVKELRKEAGVEVTL